MYSSKGSFVSWIEYGIRMHSYQIQFAFPYFYEKKISLRMECTDKCDIHNGLSFVWSSDGAEAFNFIYFRVLLYVKLKKYFIGCQLSCMLYNLIGIVNLFLPFNSFFHICNNKNSWSFIHTCVHIILHARNGRSTCSKVRIGTSIQHNTSNEFSIYLYNCHTYLA